MRGGFVACLGAESGVLERVAEHVRWHRGSAVRYQSRGLEIAAFVAPDDGPAVESDSASIRLVHGGLPVPLRELCDADGRYAAIEWDGHTLRAMRDPLGLAPLFYRIVEGAVWLATEIAPLVALARPQPDLEALSARAGFIPIDAGTGWAGIHRVVPGSTLEITFPGLVMRTSRFWSPQRLVGTYRGNRHEALGELRLRFADAVKRCCAPDGALLFSGGVDSAAIAVTARAIAGRAPHLVHVHFDGLAQSHEQHYAAAVGNSIGAPIDMARGETAPWDVDAELGFYGIPYNRLPYGLFEPALDRVSERGITAAVDGHDGDGVLGPRGGEWGDMVLHGEVRRLAAYCRRVGARRALRALAGELVPPACRPRRYRRQTYMQSVARYFCGELQARIVSEDMERWRWPAHRWKVRQLRPLLPRALIGFEQKEIEAASRGIDLRHPFADRRLVEFLISLPCAIKSDPYHIKHLLVDALGDALPQALRDRPKSDYMGIVARRVDRARCVETIRTSNVRLPHVDYARLLADGDAQPDRIPLILLVNLTRVHAFARVAS
ncbi:MAG TPA: asparagine synthase-related protein [Burkholderiales bacterium]|nr:asparagine synthase-related protein [Burkholderiales bacterium]